MQTLLDHHQHHQHHHHQHKRESSHSSSNSEALIGCGGSTGALRRKPLQLLTGIFSRKGNRREGDSVSENGAKSFYITDDSVTDVWEGGGGGLMSGSLGGLVGSSIASGGMFEDVPEPREALHSPYHAKTIDQDMENLRLSRQDNPYLQVLASRECLHDSDDGSEYEEKSLMAQSNSKGSGIGMKDPLSLAEVHARLVRSPPPIMWTRNRNSEPSFALLSSFHNSTDQECVFRFPPAGASTSVGGGGMGMAGVGGHSRPFSGMIPPQNQERGRGMLMGLESGCGLRFREKTLDDVTGKFNLSPQPRRRPEGIKTFSDFHS